MKLTRTVAWGIAAAAALGAAAAAWSLAQATPSDFVEAAAAPLVRTLQFSGRVAAQSRVEAGSTITGRVAVVHVREGDNVQAGQLLVSLDDEEARAALAQARAAERQAQARMQTLARTSAAVAQAQLRQADATLANAESELRRAEELVKQAFISGSRLDDNRRAVQVAAAQRDALYAQADSLGREGGETAQAQAQWQAARAASAAAAARVVQTAIRAPAAGKVLTRLAEPGQIVQPGRPLIGLALAGPTLIVAQVDERFLEQLRVGQAAFARPDADPGQRLQASVESVAPLVDAQRGAVEVKLAFKGAVPAFVREDMTVSVEVVTGERQRALVLPASALRHDAQGQEFVLVYDDGRAGARRVRTGLQTTDALEVVEGLAGREKVLLAQALREGDAVRLAKPRDPVAATANAGTGGASFGAALTGGMRP